jgi:nucleoside-diphosphate-sugar epimerase
VAHLVNTSLPGSLCDAVHEAADTDWQGQVLVHVGSAAEYGDAGGDLNEDCEPRPSTMYGRTKLAGTRLLASRCKALGLRGLTARLFTVYGPGEHAGRLLPSLMEAAQNDEPLRLTEGLQKRDFTYVEDVADALLRLGASPAEPGEIVNVATEQLATVRSFTETAARVLGIGAGRLQFGALPTRAGEMEHDPVTAARLKRLTNWMPTIGIEEGVRRTAEFERRIRRAAAARVRLAAR